MPSNSTIKYLGFKSFQGQGMYDGERDMPSGAFRYIKNLAFNDNQRELRQVGDTTTVTASRNIIGTITVGSRIWGLGEDGDGKFCLYYSDTNGSTWSSNITPGTSQNFVETANPFLCYYQGYVYFMNGANIWKCDASSYSTSQLAANPTGSGGFLKGGIQWQGNLYGWYNNTIYKITTGGTPSSLIAVPTDNEIVDIIPYGNYLSILGSSATEISKMYISDGVSTTTFVDIIPIGYGNVAGGAIKDGAILAVIGDNYNFQIKEYISGVFRTIFHYSGRKNDSGDILTYFVSRVKSYRNYIYFMVGASVPGTNTTANSYTIQLFRYGNKITGQTNSLSVYKDFEFVPSSITRSTNKINDFVILDTGLDYFKVFASLTDNASTPTFKEIYSGSTYAQEGVIETEIYTGGDSHYVKKPIGFSTMCQALESGQQIVVKSRVDGATDWTTIATLSDVGTVSQETNNVDSTGANLDGWKEIQFQFEITGGAILTEFLYKYELETGNQLV